MNVAKPILRLALIGGALLLAILFWRNGHQEKVGPDAVSDSNGPVGTKLSVASVQPDAKSAGTSQSGSVEVTAGNTAGLASDLRALLRAKLKQYRETKTEDDKTRAALHEELLALLTDANAGDIVLALADDELGTPFGQAALERWLAVDFSDAFKWAVARASTEDGEVSLLAKKMLARPESITALCQELPAGPWRQQLLAAAGLEAVPINHNLALTLALQMEPGDAQSNVLQTVVYDWMGHDPVAASHWLLQADGPLREQLSLVAAKAVAHTDPDMAARWLAASAATEEARAGTALTVVEIWAARDPAQTANWVGTFPAGKTRDAAVDLLVNEWKKTDSAGAENWIKQLPESPAILARLAQARADQNRTESE